MVKVAHVGTHIAEISTWPDGAEVIVRWAKVSLVLYSHSECLAIVLIISLVCDFLRNTLCLRYHDCQAVGLLLLPANFCWTMVPNLRIQPHGYSSRLGSRHPRNVAFVL